jgi:hypothetical protein|tara:strand:+ start:6745 stop:7113 length:369 start_codon:yes stop_codon:yes gene_type:complete
VKRETEVRKVANVGSHTERRKSNMEIRIGKYKISTDKYNFMIEEEVIPKRKRSESGGQPYWIILGYYLTLEAACQRLLQYNVKDTDASDLKGVISCLKDSSENIANIVKELAEVPVLAKGDR